MSDNRETEGAAGLAGGAIQVKDTRTGAEAEIPIEHGAIRAAALLGIRSGPEDEGIVSYDPAFKNTANCISRITYIDGDRGILRYRGYPIEELAGNTSYLDIAWLLIHGELPTSAESAAWAAEVGAELGVPDPLPRILDGFNPDGHPMAMFIALLAGLGVGMMSCALPILVICLAI